MAGLGAAVAGQLLNAAHGDGEGGGAALVMGYLLVLCGLTIYGGAIGQWSRKGREHQADVAARVIDLPCVAAVFGMKAAFPATPADRTT